MKKTIKEEIEEQYLRTILINDNALLIYTESEKGKDFIDVKLRYVSNKTIKEQFLTTISKEEFTMYENIVEINENRDAIAIYKIEKESLKLDRLYSLEEHTFSVDDFIDIEYKKMFPDHELSLKLLKKRGNKDGKY